MAKVAWIECPVCGGVAAVCADPDFAPHLGDVIRAEDFTYRDGTPFIHGITTATCKDCGAGLGRGLRPDMIRRGDALPPKKAAEAR